MSDKQFMLLYCLAIVQAEAKQRFIVAKGSQLIHQQLNMAGILPVRDSPVLLN